MWLESFELGELLHQLFYAVLLKLYCNLRVVPIAFAAKDGSYAVLGVANARALTQAGLAGGGGGVKLGACEALSLEPFVPRVAKKLACCPMEFPWEAGRAMGREPGAMRVVGEF